jgi:uncharacterized protein (TIGR02996 family)
LVEGKSSKFWEVSVTGTRVTTTYGRIGWQGQTTIKDYPDEAAARKAADKLMAEKTGKGYSETGGAKPGGPTPLQQALEQALVDHPDDLAAHSAYADYLSERGDLRGELIQVELALEDPRRPATERKQLQEREKTFLKQHSRRWLGELGPFLVGKWSGADKPFHYQFHRGWLDLVRVLPFPDATLAVLARCPEARLLRRLEVVYDMRYHPFDFDEFTEGPNKAAGIAQDDAGFNPAGIMAPLLDSPYLGNLRVFKLGYSDSGERMGHSTMIPVFEGCTAQQVIDLLGKCPRLEELYLNTFLPGIDRLFAQPIFGNIRVLQYYYGTSYFDYMASCQRGTAYPLQTLAKNPSLNQLTHLRLHPGRDATIEVNELDALLRSKCLPNLTHLQIQMTAYGDEGSRRIVQSGILRRLESLDIGYGNMTDEGARMLAACPDLKHLKALDVSRNCLTEEGIAALQAVGISVSAGDQHDDEDNAYLYEVDFE